MQSYRGGVDSTGDFAKEFSVDNFACRKNKLYAIPHKGRTFDFHPFTVDLTDSVYTLDFAQVVGYMAARKYARRRASRDTRPLVIHLDFPSFA